jgi:hypothetical protein
MTVKISRFAAVSTAGLPPGPGNPLVEQADPIPKLAEEEGFEPPVSLRPRLISSQVP